MGISPGSRKKVFLKALVILIMLSLLGTSVSFLTANPGQDTVTEDRSNSYAALSTTTGNNNSGAGYVKYTLDLLNNAGPYGAAFDSSNGYVYVVT